MSSRREGATAPMENSSLRLGRPTNRFSRFKICPVVPPIAGGHGRGKYGARRLNEFAGIVSWLTGNFLSMLPRKPSDEALFKQGIAVLAFKMGMSRQTPVSGWLVLNRCYNRVVLWLHRISGYGEDCLSLHLANYKVGNIKDKYVLSFVGRTYSYSQFPSFSTARKVEIEVRPVPNATSCIGGNVLCSFCRAENLRGAGRLPALVTATAENSAGPESASVLAPLSSE